ncbi:MAG TPA: protein kinase [Acidobacteriota bacterium]|nr:protein kinase [Acidobacteriota bacterium]
MKPERWREIERIYNSALDLEPARREAFIEQACRGDESLRREVEGLFKNHTEADDFFESPAVDVLARQFAADSAPSKNKPLAPLSQVGRDFGKKPLKHAPWWMYAIAAAFLICAAVRHYVAFKTPIANMGWNGPAVTDKSGLTIGYEVKYLQADSIEARAGLEVGDIVLINSDGYFPILNQPYWGHSGPYYWKTGRTYRFEIKRKGESRFISLTFKGVSLREFLTLPNYRPGVTSLLAAFLELFLAVIIAFRRPYDPVARWGALFLGVIAIVIIYSINMVFGAYGNILSFPRMIGWLSVLLPAFCFGSAASVGLTFAAVFPRRLFRGRWIWLLIWLPAVIVVPLYIFADNLPFYSFPRWYPDWYLNLGKIASSAAWCAVGVVLILNYRRLHEPNERRRVRAVVTGVAVTMLGYLPIVASKALPNSRFLARLLGPPYNFGLVLTCLGLALPISMAYAILRHRMFDIRVMIRLGLRYAAARGVLLSLVPIVAVILAADLVLHQDQPLKQILSQRGLLYAVLAGGGLVLHLYRRTWLDALDRRFFRERYDAQRVLRTVVDDIREERSFEKVASYVISQIEAALHPEFAALLTRRPGGSKYRVLAAKENSPPPIPADSKLMGLVRLLGKPMEISQSQTGWLRSQLPRQESDFLRQARLEWLFPICLTEGQTEALLAMGPKRSEEPYSREDQELLQGITSSLALLLEQSPSLASTREGFEECPKCGTCYDSGAGICVNENSKLTPVSFPRMLDHRYRFEQRLGQGGMGTVYRAFDTELEREVAVKLIRSDMTASTEAAARFKQEAKAAASFTHPNVVTVHDFGVGENRRAYLVMELLRGLTLRQELGKSVRLSATRASEVMQGACTAVDAAHRRRLLHRDLKPENIFLSNAGDVETTKVLDFGVVKPMTPADGTLSSGQTGPGMLLGTLKYMSPEQLNGEKPAESWDLWSLAVVAYEMLTGAHPFAGSTLLDLQNAIVAGRLIPLRSHLPDAPQNWQRFFDQALSTRIELRPNSAFQLYSSFKQSIQ